jgi:hypothetical protein
MRGLAQLLAAAGILAKALAADKAVFAHYMVGYSPPFGNLLPETDIWP